MERASTRAGLGPSGSSWGPTITEEEREQAANIVRALRGAREVTLITGLSSVVLPRPLVRFIAEAAAIMASGRRPMVVTTRGTPPTVNSADAALVLGVSRSTVVRWGRSGRLSFALDNGRYRFGLDEVLQLRGAHRGEARST